MDAAGLSCAPDSDSVSEPWPSPGHVLMPLTVPLCLPGWHLSVSESSKLSCPWRFCCCTYFSSLCPPSFHVLPRACRRLFYLCLVPELCAGPHIHTACLLLKLVRSWVPLPLPSRGALLWAWLYYFSANKATFTVCCYSVTKPCLTLCDPVDCSTPGFPVLPYLLEFARWCYPTISFSATPVSIFLFVFFTAVTGIQNFNSVSEIRPLLPDIQRGDLSYRFYFPVCTFYGVPIVSLWIRTFLTWGLEMTKTALLFLVSLSSPPTSVNLWDCWPRTSNSRWW